MTYLGKVRNGQIALDDAVTLPEGAIVSVAVVPQSSEHSSGDSVPTLYDRLREFVGIVKDMPEDSSVNIDHYLYGTPKSP